MYCYQYQSIIQQIAYSNFYINKNAQKYASYNGDLCNKVADLKWFLRTFLTANGRYTKNGKYNNAYFVLFQFLLRPLNQNAVNVCTFNIKCCHTLHIQCHAIVWNSNIHLAYKLLLWNNTQLNQLIIYQLKTWVGTTILLNM